MKTDEYITNENIKSGKSGSRLSIAIWEKPLKMVIQEKMKNSK